MHSARAGGPLWLMRALQAPAACHLKPFVSADPDERARGAGHRPAALHLHLHPSDWNDAGPRGRTYPPPVRLCVSCRGRGPPTVAVHSSETRTARGGAAGPRVALACLLHEGTVLYRRGRACFGSARRACCRDRARTLSRLLPARPGGRWGLQLHATVVLGHQTASGHAPAEQSKPSSMDGQMEIGAGDLGPAS